MTEIQAKAPDTATQTLNVVSHCVNSLYTSTWRGLSLDTSLQSPIALPDGSILTIYDWKGRREEADVNTAAPILMHQEARPLIERLLKEGVSFSVVTGSGEETRSVCFSIERTKPEEAIEDVREKGLRPTLTQ